MMLLEKAKRGRVALGRLEVGDGERLRRFFYRLSPETVYRRFLSPIARPDQLRRMRLLELDEDRQARLAVVDGEIVGVARFARDPGRRAVAELAVVVADAWQGQGLGTRLLAALAEAALQVGVEGFSFVALPDNQAAVRLVRRFAPDTRLGFAGGLLEGYLPLRAA
jgi:RimJ/RimL family protein N-acetyltransferase